MRRDLNLTGRTVLITGAQPRAGCERRATGVHVGRSGWAFDRLLREDVGRGYRNWPAAEDVAEAFGDG